MTKDLISRTQKKADITVPVLNLFGLFSFRRARRRGEKGRSCRTPTQVRLLSPAPHWHATLHNVSRRPAALANAATLRAAGCAANVKPPTHWAFHLTYECLHLWPRSIPPLKCRADGEKSQRRREEFPLAFTETGHKTTAFSAASFLCTHRSTRYLGSSQWCNHSHRVGAASRKKNQKKQSYLAMLIKCHSQCTALVRRREVGWNWVSVSWKPVSWKPVSFAATHYESYLGNERPPIRKNHRTEFEFSSSGCPQTGTVQIQRVPEG